jgi:hypothetical protein
LGAAMSLPAAGLLVIGLSFLIGMAGGMIRAYGQRPAKQRAVAIAAHRSPPDGLAETVRVWLADDRPAWETVEAFERDVATVLAPRPTRQDDWNARIGAMCDHPAFVRPDGMAAPVCCRCGYKLPF